MRFSSVMGELVTANRTLMPMAGGLKCRRSGDAYLRSLPARGPTTTSLPWRVELVRSERQGADRGYVGELLHAPVEQLGVDELQVDVG